MKKTICAIVAGLIVITGVTACKTGETTKLRPPRKEAQEYDCRKHDPDKVCLVPWKDKIVMYCYKGKIPRTVRYREECK